MIERRTNQSATAILVQSQLWLRRRAVLDLGCGTGSNRSIWKPKSYVGIEVEPPLGASKDVQPGDFTDLSCWRDLVEDAVVFWDSLEHVSKHQGRKVLKEAIRLARIVVLWIPYDERKLRKHYKDGTKLPGPMKHRSRWTERDLPEDAHIIISEQHHKDHPDGDLGHAMLARIPGEQAL